MGVKLANALGAEVTVLSTSPSKEQDAKDLGAHRFVLTSDEDQLGVVNNQLDFILDTVSGAHDYYRYLQLLRTNGMLILIGISMDPMTLPPLHMIFTRKGVAGSLIGGIPETQEMLEFCARHHIAAEVEMIAIQDINEAYRRILGGDVKYRFVIDMASL